MSAPPGSGSDANFGTPIQPGQVLNPEGKNQYTYRKEAEENLDVWLREKDDEGKTNSQLIIQRMVDDAISGAHKGYALKLVLDRILPAVQKHDVDISSTDVPGLGDALAAIDARRRSQSGDRDTAAPASEGDE